MRQLFRIANICRQFVLIFPCIVSEHIFKISLSCAKHSDLNACIGKQLIQHRFDQVNAFLVCHACDNAKQHRSFVLLKTKKLLEHFLICPFARRPVLNAKILPDQRI